MITNSSRNITILSLLFFNAQIVYAQIEANYWTHQFGSKGLLLNGAVISSPDDETSAYYNPGAVGLDDDLGLLVSFITPTYSSLTISDFLGDGNDVSDRGLSFAPGFFGLRFRPFRNKSLTVAISNFERYDSDISFDDRVTSNVTTSPDLIYRFDLDFRKKITEKWRGISLSYNLSNNLGIGISQFSIWHRQQFTVQRTSEIKLATDLQGISQFNRMSSSYKFNINSAFVTKLGISYKSNNLCFGLTYTSPMYGAINRNGTYVLENQLVDNVNERFVSISNRNTISSLVYRSPHSIGLGIDLHQNRSSISVSSEFFFGIDEYRILDEVDDSFENLTTITNETLFRVESENESVLNFAVGLQQDISDKSSLFLGFRTDFNQKNKLSVNEDSDFTDLAGDIFHLSGGNMIGFKNNQFSWGFDYAFGKKTNSTQLVDLTQVDPSTFPPLRGSENVNNKFNSFMIFITYDFIFKRFSKDEK